mgnify:CR=1 FL=1
MENLFIEIQSRYDFDQTVEKLSEKIQQPGTGWKILIVHDLQLSLQKNNFEVLPVKVMEICNPAYSSRLLDQDDKRINSTMMPCRISVYEKSDGKTYVSIMNFSILAAQIDGVVAEVMNQSFTDAIGFFEEIK